MSFTTTTEIPAGKGVTRLSAWSHYIAWAGARTDTTRPDEVHLYDRDTGKQRVIAQAKSSNGQTDWVRGSGTHVVYTDQARVTDDNNPRTAWSVIAVDIATGEQTTIDQSTGTADQEYVPYPVIDGDMIVWDRPAGAKKVLLAHDLAKGQRLVLAHDTTSDFVAVQSGKAFFTGDTPEGRDLFSVGLAAGQTPVRLTRTGQVSSPVASSDWVSWQQPLRGDPTETWVMPASGGQPVRIPGEPQPAYAATGRGFVAWSDLGALRAVRLPYQSGAASVVVGKGDSVPARLSAFDKTLVWATVTHYADSDETTVIHVMEAG